jgi:hypothetical protein
MFDSLTATLREVIDQFLQALSPADAACVLVAIAIIALAKHAGMWIYALVALPGTFAHELAHFLVGLLLGARPSFPSLIPVRTERGWRLGAVSFRVGHLRALPIALAPLLLLPLACWWALALLHTATWPLYALHVWITAALLTASMPSRSDWKLALPALGVLLLVGVLAAAAWWYLLAR